MNTVDKVIKHFGGPSSLAKLLGVTPQAISKWKHIPSRRVKQIIELPNNKFSYEELLG